MSEEKPALEQDFEESENVLDLLAEKPQIRNYTLKAADTEYRIPLPPRTRKYEIQARTSVDLRLSFEKGAVADTTQGKEYWTLKADSVYWEDHLDLEGDLILYVAGGTAGIIVEVKIWWK